MQQLFETIKILNGKPQFLEFHNWRLNMSRKQLFNAVDEINLQSYLSSNLPSLGLYKCRVTYAQTVIQMEYLPYQLKMFKRFKLVNHDSISYDFKFCDRTQLNELVARKGEADDILLIKQGLVTDTSIANVAFLIQGQWVTPKFPLLKGTTRERWLKAGKLVAKEIRLADLNNCSQMALMNAMIDFCQLVDFELEFS
jgi:4-amino-4-deoxychorismate lyase